MRPGSARILDSVIWSLERYVAPELGSPFARSVLATVGNLLRHLQLRAEREAELLWEDNGDLERVLAETLDRVGTRPELAAALGDLPERMRAVLQRPAEDAFPTVARLDARSAALGSALEELIRALGAVRERFDADPVYRECRAAIRAYLARRLERDDALVTPAFTGSRR